MSVQGKSLHILTPMYGGMCTGTYHEATAQLFLKLQQYNIPFMFSHTYNESLISRARNRLCDIYMKENDYTHCVFIDADIGFDPNDILVMLEMDLDIVGAPCVKKSIRWDRVQKMMQKNGNGQHQFTNEQMMRVSGDFVVNWKDAGKKEIKMNEPVEVMNVGTGIMMIRRNVCTTYQEKYPDRWYESRSDPASLPGPTTEFFRSGINPDSHDYDSEDYCFCNDCRDLGFKVFLLPWMKTTHTGTQVFQGDMVSVAQTIGEL